MKGTLAKAYPNVAYWITGRGRIELGVEYYSESIIRVIDEGGLVWEGQEHYDTLEEALAEADAAIGKWLQGEEP